MMLRTTTQRGLFYSTAARSVPLRSTTVALRATQAIQRTGSIAPRAISQRLSDVPSRWFSSSRCVAQPTAKYTASPLTDAEYHKLSNQVLDSLTESFETLLEDADIDKLEEQARAKKIGAVRGSPASEWDIECAVSVCLFVLRVGTSELTAPPL